MEVRVARALEAVRSFVAGDEPLDETLLRLSRLAVDALAADMAGLTLLHPDGRAATAVATDEQAREVDEAQYDADRGPCLQALRSETVIRVDDAASDARWPEFASRAIERQVRSSLSLPLLVNGAAIGALNLYSSLPGNFADGAEPHGLAFAREASVALASAQAYWNQADTAAGLARAMASRAVIEQAKGVLIATMGVSAEEAFDLLRQQSQAENRKLREVATEIVEAQQRDRRGSGTS